MKILTFLILIAVTLSQAAFATEEADELTSQKSFEFAFLIFEDFRITPEIGIVYGPVLSENLGIPDRTVTKRGGTRDPTYMVNREFQYYDGLELTMSRGIDASPSDWTWLERVYISSPRFVLRHGLRVGANLQEFEDKLGPWRDRRASDASEVSFYAGGYSQPGGVTHAAHATVTLTVDSEGNVTAVAIEYWAD